MFKLTPGDANLTRFENGLAALGDFRARKVMARALNRTGGPTLTAVRRKLREETSVPMAIIRKQVIGRKAWAGVAGGEGRIEYVIQASGRPIPLKAFRPVELRRGVRAKVWGRFQLFEGAFMKGGRFPNRVPLPALGGQVFKRVSAERKPIEMLYGPALPKEMVEPKVVAVFNQAIARLPDDVAHELHRELSL